MNNKPTVQRIHELKSWPEFFAPVFLGVKHFEIRKNDRGFLVGDLLRLLEYEPLVKSFTGREWWAIIAYVYEASPDAFYVTGLVEGYAVLSIIPAPPETVLVGQEILERVGEEEHGDP